jgi:iron complex transport system ATP-binding protein
LLRADSVSYAHDREGRRAAASRPAAVPGHLDPGVTNVSVSVDRGGILGILGPNGSGKTTLLRLLAGMLRPQSGSITLDGAPIDGMPRQALARRIAIVPQETHLAFDYSVLEIALMGRYPHLGPFELEGPRDVAIARDALAATGTAALERRQFATLSGGEKQRVIIASALAQEANILLLDEPTASLDIGYQFEIASLLTRLSQSRDLTIAVATHDLNFAAGLCHSLAMLSEGRLVNAGPTADTLTSLNIQALYGVVADVYPHHAAGHLTVVPLRRIQRD